MKNKKFDFMIVLVLLLICIFCTTKTFQNDTFYTIKVGESIFKNGVDMIDHFSIHNLIYTYPHWLFDLIIYVLYNLGGFRLLYYLAIFIYIVIGLLLYFLNKNLTKDFFFSGFFAIISVCCLVPFIAVRAQIITYILFIIEIFSIEKFLLTSSKKYLILLPIISLIIVNIHCAVWPFFFILFLPSIVEFLICLYRDKQINIKHFKKESGRFLTNNKISILNDKILLSRNDNIKYFFLIIFICILTGFITLNGTTAFTYLFRTLQGNTTSFINEHRPPILTENFSLIMMICYFIFSLVFFKTKIKLRDLFLMVGLFILAFSSYRHIALLIICGNFVLTKLYSEFFKEILPTFDEKITKILTKKSIMLTFIILMLLLTCLSLKTSIHKKNYVDETLYPIDAASYITKNLDLKKIRLFNEYNYGAYLIYRGIPVFVDSRSDLYTKEFNKIKRNITDDTLNINYNYKEIFDYYNITHAIVHKNKKFKKSVLYEILILNEKYKIIYEDENFAIFEIKQAN